MGGGMTRYRLVDWRQVTGEPPGGKGSNSRLGSHPSSVGGLPEACAILVVRDDDPAFFVDRQRYVIDQKYEPCDVAYVEHWRAPRQVVDTGVSQLALIGTSGTWAFYRGTEAAVEAAIRSQTL